MRVTNNMMTMNLLYNVNNNLERMSNYQDQLATGKRISRPSDDPVLASKVLSRKTDLAELEQYDKNTRDALGWLEISEKALEDNGDILGRIRELVVQGANGVNTEEETQKIALEVKAMKKQLVTNANSTFAGRYIFSGFETNKKLMNEDGTYNIDIEEYTLTNKPVVKYEVSVGESINVMTSGIDIYGTVSETNIMTSTFPSGTSTGTKSTKTYIHGSFDLTDDYTAGNLDFNIGATLINVDESTLNGTNIPLTKDDVLTAYNDALGTNGVAFYDSNNELVIESAVYGSGSPITLASTALFNPTIEAGIDATIATITGSGPMNDPLTADDIDVLKRDGLTIVVNGISKNVKPDAAITFTAPNNTPADYAAAIQAELDTELGPGVISVTAPGNILTLSTVSTQPGVEPKITVDFPRTHTSELMEDINELLGYLDSGDHASISNMLDTVDGHVNNMLALRADIGARVNRMEMITKKIASSNVAFTQLLSDAEDADMSEVIMYLKNAENVYNASLSVGAKVIQASLVDFLR